MTQWMRLTLLFTLLLISTAETIAAASKKTNRFANDLVIVGPQADTAKTTYIEPFLKLVDKTHRRSEWTATAYATMGEVRAWHKVKTILYWLDSSTTSASLQTDLEALDQSGVMADVLLVAPFWQKHTEVVQLAKDLSQDRLWPLADLTTYAKAVLHDDPKKLKRGKWLEADGHTLGRDGIKMLHELLGYQLGVPVKGFTKESSYISKLHQDKLKDRQKFRYMAQKPLIGNLSDSLPFQVGSLLDQHAGVSGYNFLQVIQTTSTPTQELSMDGMLWKDKRGEEGTFLVEKIVNQANDPEVEMSILILGFHETVELDLTSEYKHIEKQKRKDQKEYDNWFNPPVPKNPNKQPQPKKSKLAQEKGFRFYEEKDWEEEIDRQFNKLQKDLIVFIPPGIIDQQHHRQDRQPSQARYAG